MIGAIIGDLAAWTYKRDKDLFYAELVHPEAKLSEISLAIISIFGLMMEKHSTMDWKDMKNRFCQIFPLQSNDVADVAPVWSKFLVKEPGIPEEVKRIMNVATDIVGGWCNLSRQTAAQWGIRFHGCKEEMYLTQVADIIYRLRHGATKKEAIDETSFISSSFGPSPSKPEVSPLGYAYLAWHCFNDAFDFTSAIHNAMRCPYGNKHVLGALTGALAEAMYGCESLFLKRKYSPDGNWYHSITLPEEIQQTYKRELEPIRTYEREHRLFFPKNSALTNVERHHWKKCWLPFYDQTLSSKEREKLLKSGYTSWDNRFGTYLDDGWFYCYRSQFLLLRFRLEESKDHRWSLVDFQLSGEMDFKACAIGLADALIDTCNIMVNTQTRHFILGLDYCRFYKGEDNPPSSLSQEESVFWCLERMYYSERFPEEEQRERWERDAMTICLEDSDIAEFMQFPKIPMAVKGMVAFSIQDLLYHAPMGGAKGAYDYAGYIGAYYGQKKK